MAYTSLLTFLPSTIFARVGARSDEHAVELDVLDRRAGLEAHVDQRALLAVAAGRGHGRRDRGDLGGIGAPADHRADGRRVDDDLLVERRAVLGVELGPRGIDLGPVVADPGERGLVGGDHARAAAALDGHVADRHPALHRQALDGGAGELDDVAGRAVDAHVPDRRQDEVLGGDAAAQLALVADPHGLRLGLDEALGRQHVLDLARPDAEGQRAERAVRGRVAVAADDRHARLGQAQLRADDVDDALVLGAQAVDRDAELRAVALERLDLGAAEHVLDARRDGRAVGRHVVVGGGDGPVGPAHGAAGESQAVEGLRAGDLVDEVQVDVDQVGGDFVRLPDLVEQGLGHVMVLNFCAGRR
jgi:hypothetical protein